MRRPVRDALALAILFFLALGIAALDAVVGRHFSLWFVYVLAVSPAAAIGGLRAGLAFTALSTALIVAVGFNAGHPFPTDAHFYFDVAGDLVTFLVVVGLSLGIRERFHKGIGELLPAPEETEKLRRVVAAQHGKAPARR